MVGAPVSDAVGNDLGVIVKRVDGRVVQLSEPVSVSHNDQLQFGVSSAVVYAVDTTGIDVGALVTSTAGIAPETVVVAVDHETGRIMLSEEVVLPHGAEIQFGEVGTVIEVVDATGVVAGAPVSPTTGVGEGIKVVRVSDNTITLSKRVSVPHGSSLAVGAKSETIAVDDVSGIIIGVLASGTGVLPGTRVVAIDTSASTVTLDTKATVSAGATLGFGSKSSSVVINTTNYATELAGERITVNGVDSGVDVVSIIGSTVALTGDLDVAHNDVIGFDFAGTLSTDQIVVDDATGLTVGGALTGSPGTLITEIDSTSGLVTLSAAESVAKAQSMQFGFSGAELVLDDVSKIALGSPITGAGLPQDVFVTGINGARLTVSRSISVEHGDLLNIGFASDVVRVDSISGINVGVPVSGADGIRPGTTVTAIDPVSREITLSQPVRVNAGDPIECTLPFGERRAK
jgi:hypothetical protein